MTKKVVYFHYFISDTIMKLALESDTLIEGIRENDSATDGLIIGFEKLGYKVVFDYKTDFFGFPNFFVKFKFFNLIKRVYKKVFRKLDSYLLNKLLQKKILANKANLLFTVLNPTISIGTLLFLKENNIKSIEWFGVFPFQFKSRDNVILTVPHFDLIVSAGNLLPHFDNRFKPASFLQVPPALNFKSIKKWELSIVERKKYSHDIVFIGSVAKVHSNRWDILEAISKKYKNLSIYGYGIDNVPDKYAFKKNYKGSIWGDDYGKVISNSKIVLNLFLNNYSKMASGMNTRAFEIPGCGSFELSQYVPNLEEFFTIGEDIEAFKDVNDLLNKIDYYLKNKEEREIIANCGFQKVQQYTFSNLIKKILTKLN
ncbi:MAG: hypothetical protein COB02_03750 [Candidatus Cloacimonadota bacterium]|nr:MAG: hypothetical protein COB02_03750 [Candidatus Cloacimonadota bacterium]